MSRAGRRPAELVLLGPRLRLRIGVFGFVAVGPGAGFVVVADGGAFFVGASVPVGVFVGRGIELGTCAFACCGGLDHDFKVVAVFFDASDDGGLHRVAGVGIADGDGVGGEVLDKRVHQQQDDH